MKKEIKITSRVVYSKECKKCKKVIKGFSKSNLDYNFEQHLGKHERDKSKV